MKILIVSFFDDNFGDMLIRICFKQLLRTVLHNLQIENYEIDEMPLKEIDEEKIKKSNLIFFSGGGLFGISYLDFAEYLDKITDIADKKNIPVIFSSIGVNNMDANEENSNIITNILNKKCIKFISVRENIEFFKKYSSKDLNIVKVCDPALWTKYVYHLHKKKNTKKCIGINVVRGGLFKANDKNWDLKDEMNYLSEIKSALENDNIEYKFYTNGSFLDNNTLHYFEKQYQISKQNVIYPHTTRDFVDTISTFDATICIRMHSSIVSYSMDIPAINLVWNDKLKYFYKDIGYSKRAIELENWNVENVYTKLKTIMKKRTTIDRNYLMSLYKFIYTVILKTYPSINKNDIYSFDEVVNYLNTIKVDEEEDIKDLRFKIQKGEIMYLSLFEKKLEKDRQLKDSKNEIKTLKKKVEKINVLQKQLDSINKKLIVRIYRKIKRIIKKITRK